MSASKLIGGISLAIISPWGPTPGQLHDRQPRPRGAHDISPFAPGPG